MSGSILLLDTAVATTADGRSGFTLPSRGFQRLTYAFDVTAVTGTWAISVEYDEDMTQVATVALVAGVTSTGLNELNVLGTDDQSHISRLDEAETAIPLGTQVFYDVAAGGGSLSGKLYAMMSGPGGFCGLLHTQASTTASVSTVALAHGKRAHNQATFFLDVTTVTGTWVAAVEWDAGNGSTALTVGTTGVAEIVAGNGTGLYALDIAAPFDAADAAIPEPTGVSYTKSAGAGSFAAKLFGVYSD